MAIAKQNGRNTQERLGLLETIWSSTTERVAEEVADMQMIANQDQIVIAPWDYRFMQKKYEKKNTILTPRSQAIFTIGSAHRCDALCCRSFVFL